RHRRFAGRPVAEPEPAMHVDRGDDAAAQVEHAGDLGRGERHARHPLRHEYVLHLRDRQPEQLAADHHGDVLDEVAAVIVVGHRLRRPGHAASLIIAACSLSAATRPGRSNLAMWPWKRPCRPRSIDSGLVSADSAMIGRAAVRSFLRTASASSNPVMPGISRSVTIMSTWPFLSTSSASSAPGTVVTA